MIPNEKVLHYLMSSSGRAKKSYALTEAGSLAHLGTVITKIHRKHQIKLVAFFKKESIEK